MTRTLHTLRRNILTLAVAAFALALPAAADTLNFTLTGPFASAAPGGTVSFDATVSAPLTNTGTLFLVGDSTTLSIPGATLDDSPFLLNFPLSLNPGDTFTGELFTVALPASIAQGVYTGFFEIQGGSDPSSQDILGTVPTRSSSPPSPPPGCSSRPVSPSESSPSPAAAPSSPTPVTTNPRPTRNKIAPFASEWGDSFSTQPCVEPYL
jgi:hypothetical protein